MRNVVRANCLLSVALLATLYGCKAGGDSSGRAGREAVDRSAARAAAWTTRSPPSPPPKALHVQGNTLRDPAGTTVRLLGVNRAGTEYMCTWTTQGGKTFDGSTGPNSVAAMLTWNINTVRVPLNEDCWLGIDGAAAGTPRTTRRRSSTTSRRFTTRTYVVLELHWSRRPRLAANRRDGRRRQRADFWRRSRRVQGRPDGGLRPLQRADLGRGDRIPRCDRGRAG